MLASLLLLSAATTAPGTSLDWHPTPAAIQARCDAALAAARSKIAVLTSGKLPGGLPALDLAVAELDDTLTAERFLVNISSDAAVRDASGACSDKLAELSVELAADPGVYALARAFQKSARDPVDLQLAKIYLEEGRRAGAGLYPESRAKVTELLKRLEALQGAYFRALGEDRSGMTLTAAEAASLPPSFRANLVPVSGGYTLAVNMQTYAPFMRSEASGDARRRFDNLYYNRGGQENVARLREALEIRREVARLLGFGSWAALVADTRMAKTPERPRAMLEDVDAKLLPKARAEIAVLAVMKKADGDATSFAAWDYAYYEAKLERERYSVDDEAVRRYFPADKAIPAMLHLYERLFGLRFTEVRDAKPWASGVQEFAIQDAADGHLLGWFFLDLAPRPEKALRPANFALRAGHRDAKGGYVLPISSVVGSGPAAAPGQPALYGHHDMLELFHELGHVMHTTLSTAPYAKLYGANVREDFVEAPSQMMENWMWQPSVLRQVSSELGTGKPLPDELIARLTALEHVADGAFWTRQAFFGLYDLALHGAEPVDPVQAWEELQAKYMALPPEPGTAPAGSFIPLMGGYDAGYYGYVWSRVYAEDMFGLFQGHMDDPEVGLRFRREVLAPGGGEEPEVLVRRFLGRAPQPGAFYRELGLADSAH